MEEPMPPKFDYCLCESDPDVLILRRQDGAFVGAFSARGATREGIVQAAEEDYRALLGEAHQLAARNTAAPKLGRAKFAEFLFYDVGE
jgi:hypothetical protein